MHEIECVPPELLAEAHETHVKIVTEFLAQWPEEGFVPTLLTFPSMVPHIYGDGHWDDPSYRRGILGASGIAAWKQYLETKKPSLVVSLASTAWMAPMDELPKGGRVADCPSRKEVMSIATMTIDRWMLQTHFPILRENEEGPLVLGERVDCNKQREPRGTRSLLSHFYSGMRLAMEGGVPDA